ncbi:hypothetical protein [Caenimonas sp. SL110]|uniref:hypothetical protein n=1 Tax=Caenimonas sp. SL110 TaxID=1450524 RepID=UPI00128D948C|nr:hypothetical protein [Caenimonas sp. SL110]
MGISDELHNPFHQTYQCGRAAETLEKGAMSVQRRTAQSFMKSQTNSFSKLATAGFEGDTP